MRVAVHPQPAEHVVLGQYRIRSAAPAYHRFDHATVITEKGHVCIARLRDGRGRDGANWHGMSGWNDKIIKEFRANGGEGVGFFGDHLLLLTTRGAKSGQAHTVPLVFHRDGERLVVIASKGGAPHHPDWYHNLVAHPDAEVEVGSDRFRVHATPVAGGPERDRLYAQQVKIMHGFAEYETKTTRVIPAVLLERQEPTQLAA